MIISRRKLLRGLSGVGALPLISRPSLAQSLSLRKSLAFPAGAAPGFDPTHPAAKGISGGEGISVVAANGNFIDLVTGRKGAPGAALASAIQSDIGPGVNIPSATAGVDFSGQLVATAPGATFAGIVQFDSIPGGFQFIICADLTGFNLFGLSNAANSPLTIFAGVDNPSSIILAASTPYFVAASTSGGVYNFVAQNLRTGAVRKDNISGGAAIGPTDGTYRVGNFNNTSQGTIGTIAAAMYAPTYLSLSQLLAWSADPWSFWYPQQDFSMVGLSANAARLRSLIGVGQ